MAGDSLFAARFPNMDHTEPPNVIGQETVYGPTGDLNRRPLAYPARTLTTELKSYTHRRLVTISICLIRFIPESTRNHAGTEKQTLCCLQPKHGPTLSHKMSKGREKLPTTFTLADDRTVTNHIQSLPRRYKSWLVPQGSTSVLYT